MFSNYGSAVESCARKHFGEFCIMASETALLNPLNDPRRSTALGAK